ncbi:hypothetical protein GW17_00005914 [Ensete ventricosum]|nr:hypothetical protein GW17_00005914 [Ensete ventricosum]RZS00141.1 hypothetical protein BHM03_00029793 [Ensete ventricosum]
MPQGLSTCKPRIGEVALLGPLYEPMKPLGRRHRGGERTAVIGISFSYLRAVFHPSLTYSTLTLYSKGLPPVDFGLALRQSVLPLSILPSFSPPRFPLLSPSSFPFLWLGLGLSYSSSSASPGAEIG